MTEVTPYQKIEDELSNNINTVKKEVSQGKRIGSYKLGLTIGRGAFSEVKVGLHMLTQEHVAVKIVEKGKQGTQATLNMMKQEIKIMDQLSHPNILRLYEVVETLDKFYCVIEYVEGGTLQSFLTRKKKSGKRIAVDRCRYFYLQIIDAVEYMHNLGVWHRDLKNENILLSPDNTIRVADFGISTTEPGLLHKPCGTPPCIPPEVFNHTPYHGRDFDIWTLGVLLYQLSSGHMPFNAHTREELKEKITKIEYEMPKHFSQDLADLISKILVEKPSDRVQIAEMRLHPWMNGEMYNPPLKEMGDEAQHDVRENLRKLGMPDDKIDEASSSNSEGQDQPRNSVTGSYRIALHQVQMHKMKLLFDGEARFSVAPKGIPGAEEEEHVTDHSLMFEEVKKRRIKCVIL